MLPLHVRTDELASCGSDLAQGARRLADAVAALDRRADDGLMLEHPTAVDAYGRFFGAWSLRLHDVVAALDEGAEAAMRAAKSYEAWERYVGSLTR